MEISCLNTDMCKLE